MIVDGLTVEQIATRLGLTPHPVRTRIGRLRRLFDADTTAQLVHRAHVLGLFQVPRPRAPYVHLVGDDVAPVIERGPVLSPKPRATAVDARLIAARLEASFRGDGS